MNPCPPECEALVRCDGPAQFWVNFHGCDNALICETHLNQWLEWIDEAIEDHNALYCGDCRHTFNSISEYLNWRDADGIS